MILVLDYTCTCSKQCILKGVSFCFSVDFLLIGSNVYDDIIACWGGELLQFYGIFHLNFFSPRLLKCNFALTRAMSETNAHSAKETESQTPLQTDQIVPTAIPLVGTSS